ELDRGDVIREVRSQSPAAAAGLKAGDVLQRLNGVPIHSLADAQLALDRAPRGGTIQVSWRRGDTVESAKLSLPDGWRKTDISWRASAQDFVPSVRLHGADLTPDEKKALGLPVQLLAFRQKYPLSSQAKAAGIRQDDIIL